MRLLLLILLLFSLTAAVDAKDLSTFEGQSCHLHELKAKAAKLRSHSFRRAKKIINEIDRREDRDPQIRAHSRKDAKRHKRIAGKYHHPFDYNRSGKAIKGLFINASDVHTKYQNFVIAACPKTSEDARNFFEAALYQNVSVYVSALKSNEARHHCNNFWREKSLKKITLRDGTKIRYLSSLVLDERASRKRKTAPQIIESSLSCSNGRALIHLHYEGWRDKKAMPSEGLLNKLLDRLYELSPNPEVPIAINCRGGTGRSGTIAVSLYLRRLVDSELTAGKGLDEITVNIPEVIYSFRRHRTSIIGTPAQLAQIYSVLGDYYDRLKEVV